MRSPKRVRREPHTRSVVGRNRDVEVLKSLTWARFLKTSQVTRLHFPSQRTCQRRLRAMLDHGLVRAHLQGAAMHLENVVTLTPRGVAQLELRGVDNVRPSRVPRLQKLAHGLAVRDVFAAFVLAERVGSFVLDDFRFEEDLAGEPVFKTAGIIPDALAVVEHQGQRSLLGCEVDLGTETTMTLRAKLEAWKKLFDSRILGGATLPFVCEIESRLATLERLLTESGCSATLVLRRALFECPSMLSELFAPTIRAVRTVSAPIDSQFEPVLALKTPAF